MHVEHLMAEAHARAIAAAERAIFRPVPRHMDGFAGFVRGHMSDDAIDRAIDRDAERALEREA